MLKIIEGYKPENNCNTDETGLFFMLPPKKKLSFKGDPCNGGNNSKDRMTVLLACSVSGTDKLPPLVNGKSKRAHCFKNVKKLPTKYGAKRNGWVAEAVSADSIRALDGKMISRIQRS